MSDDFAFCPAIIRDTAPLGSDDPILQQVMREMERGPAVDPAPADDGWQPAPFGMMAKGAAHVGGARTIHGIASTPRMNAKNTSLASEGAEVALPIPVFSEHAIRGAPIGEVFYVAKGPDRVYVRARLFDTHAAAYAWGLIVTGEVRACSTGAAKPLELGSVVDGKSFFPRWPLTELSICRRGANPDAVFEVMAPGDTGAKFMTGEAADVRPSLPYAGTWKAGETYPAGTFITHRGALWHAEAQSRGVRPGESPVCWKLAAKAGKPVERER